MERLKDLSLGTKIELLRKFRGMMQKELAVKLKIDQSNLSDYEKDKNLPSLIVLKQIAKICRMHPVYFFDNVLPTAYEQLITDLEYAFYIGNLPPDAAESIRFGLKAMYQFTLLKDSNPIRNLIDDAADESEKIKDMEKYLLLLKKKGISDN